jgi:hypothetical protein
MYAEFIAECVKDFLGKKSDLSLVAKLVVEKPVAPNPMSSYTFYLGNFDGRVLVRLSAMVAEVVMAWREVKVNNFHITSYHAFPSLHIDELR